MKLAPCTIYYLRTYFTGWRDREGNFLPDTEGSSFQSYKDMGLLPQSWLDKAESIWTLRKKADLVVARDHEPGDCPAVADGFPTFRLVKNGLVVHGVVMTPSTEPHYLFPHRDCPNKEYAKNYDPNLDSPIQG